MMRSLWNRFRKKDEPVAANPILNAAAAPMTESIQNVEVVPEEVVAERKKFASEHIAARLGERDMSLKDEWSREKDRVEFTDEKGDTLCVIKWPKDKDPVVLDYVTGAFVLAANKRFAYSCAIGERMSNDGSPAGKLASARSEVGGVMCTN